MTTHRRPVAPVLRASGVANAVEDESVRREAVRALLVSPKTLPPKLFYDDEGARLFERICTLEEYYLPRAELEILRARSSEIAELAGPGSALVEYGSGAAVKIRVLLDALQEPVAYVPIDISVEQLHRVADGLRTDYPGLAVHPVRADFTAPLVLPAATPRARRIAFFPGSTIGNFHPKEAVAFLRRVRMTIGHDGALVLGVDRRKDHRVLHKAYNDAAGVTAAFNLNVLARLNREAGAHFDLTRFRHHAFFNAEESRIEMHLESLHDQIVRVGGVPIEFDQGETIWTESSYKYDRERLNALVEAAGFAITRMWTDVREQFWVAFLSVTAAPGGR
jgi:dimethylhistidine N-methyltransferase